ncbi:MAG TPA: YciI family protein [Candidatus Dormibacteraeota bacterium]|nr:YciI family protein [Candidatus Dormibacteraeota bacterium]
MALYVVRLRRGGPWDWSLDMREQVGWGEHARFMDGLVDAGFVLLAGPLEGDREVLLIVEAGSEDAVRERLAEDPWAQNGMLRPASIERWTVLLDGRG